jgi:hypothetical protein
LAGVFFSSRWNRGFERGDRRQRGSTETKKAVADADHGIAGAERARLLLTQCHMPYIQIRNDAKANAMSDEIVLPRARGRRRLFQPGQSGNPAGRRRGSRNKATLAAATLLDGEALGLTRRAVEAALAGDSDEAVSRTGAAAVP